MAGTTVDPEVETINVSPVKRFFISILTRDIEIVAAILDLVDNAVDSANELRPNQPLDGLRIEISTRNGEFTIVDNCKGITLKAAREYAFRLGRPDEVESSPTSIGQFGVGLKRALFKLGGAFEVDSSTSDSHFSVQLDVKAWAKEANDWTIPLVNHAASEGRFPPAGTRIRVTDLSDDVKKFFADSGRIGQLRDELKSKHRVSIERGLVISLNGDSLERTPTMLAVDASDEKRMYPLIQKFQLQSADGKPIDVEIYAGVSKKAETNEDAEPEDVSTGSEDAGWYVFGNERLLLAADQTLLTGWGGKGNLPRFHPQYDRFRGYVYMTAEDSIALPWNTTKTGVESSDPVWTSVRGEMIKAGRQVITLLNHLKLERRAVNGVQMEDPKRPNVPITSTLSSASSVSTTSLRNEKPRALSYVTPNPELSREVEGKRISYTVPVPDFVAASEILGTTKAVDIGRKTFDYFLESEATP
ncbi:ATP-binding protein [Microbacterium sp. ProA8]|uniref:ATP-binding protein n=1 Tax=Microbacterium chionoecetis TaxID=3153754 RepID=UPI003264DCA8